MNLPRVCVTRFVPPDVFEVTEIGTGKTIQVKSRAARADVLEQQRAAERLLGTRALVTWPLKSGGRVWVTNTKR